MLLLALISGSFIGLVASVFAYLALGLGALTAVLLYLACALVPTLITVALIAVQAFKHLSLPSRIGVR